VFILGSIISVDALVTEVVVVDDDDDVVDDVDDDDDCVGIDLTALPPLGNIGAILLLLLLFTSFSFISKSSSSSNGCELVVDNLVLDDDVSEVLILGSDPSDPPPRS